LRRTLTNAGLDLHDLAKTIEYQAWCEDAAWFYDPAPAAAHKPPPPPSPTPPASPKPADEPRREPPKSADGPGGSSKPRSRSRRPQPESPPPRPRPKKKHLDEMVEACWAHSHYADHFMKDLYLRWRARKPLSQQDIERLYKRFDSLQR
jgi:hypothetical protein